MYVKAHQKTAGLCGKYERRHASMEMFLAESKLRLLSAGVTKRPLHHKHRHSSTHTHFLPYIPRIIQRQIHYNTIDSH